MSFSIENLGANFQEVFHAFQINGKADTPLVSNIFGTRIYDSTVGWGRLWRYFYGIIKFLSGQDLEKSRLLQAIEKTNTVYQEYFKANLKELDEFKDLIKKKSEKTDFDEKKYKKIKTSLTYWNHHTSQFVEWINTKHNKQISTFFNKEALKVYSSNALQQFQSVVDLENICKKDLPYFILRKIFKKNCLDKKENSSLDEKDEIILKKFIDTLNNIEYTPINLIHRALNCLCPLFINDNHSKTVKEVILFLETKGCDFQKIDPKQKAFQDQLKTGDLVKIGKNIYRLKKEITSPKKSKRRRVYTIDGDDDHVIRINENSATSIYDNSAPTTTGHELLAQIKEISSDGKMALVERLYPFEIPSDWVDKTELCDVDIKLIEYISWWVKQFIDTKKIPKDFSAEVFEHEIFLHRQNRVKLPYKIKDETLFDIAPIEETIWNFVKKNHVIYGEIARSSGLYETNEAYYYKKLFYSSLEFADATPPISYEVFSANCFPKDGTIPAKVGIKIKKDVETFYLTLLEEIKINKDLKNTSPELIKESLYEAYENLGILTFLSPDLKNHFYEVLRDNKNQIIHNKTTCSPQ